VHEKLGRVTAPLEKGRHAEKKKKMLKEVGEKIDGGAKDLQKGGPFQKGGKKNLLLPFRSQFPPLYGGERRREEPLDGSEAFQEGERRSFLDNGAFTLG